MIPAFLFMAIAGGVLALGIAWWRGRLVRTMRLTARLCNDPGATKTAIESSGSGENRFAYAPAIALGALVAALGSENSRSCMNRVRIFIVLVLAILAGGGFAFGTYDDVQNVPVKTVTVPTGQVVVADADLEVAP